MTTEQRKKKSIEWQEYDAIAAALDSIKKLGHGEITLQVTDSKLVYISLNTGFNPNKIPVAILT